LPADSEVIVCLGTDFRHKNRVFALRLVDELQRRHGWSGRLVLAGPHVREGGSVREERLFLERHPGVAAATIDVRAVSEEEKVWLLERSALMLYPTVHEGFGLVPFEAADHGLPCMWAPGTSLSEILPPSAATILPWDAAATADRAIALMRDAAEREANIAGVHQAAAGLSWDAAAARLIDVYNEACDEAPTPASAFERRHGQMKDGISDDGMRLVGPDGALPREVERPLLALAMRPQIRTPVFGAIKLGYRASYRLRRRGRP
jgi:glycosyltransferase involved in cell wall biosynthesis